MMDDAGAGFNTKFTGCQQKMLLIVCMIPELSSSFPQLFWISQKLHLEILVPSPSLLDLQDPEMLLLASQIAKESTE